MSCEILMLELTSISQGWAEKCLMCDGVFNDHSIVNLSAYCQVYASEINLKIC